MSIGISPPQLLEDQSFDFEMFIGARASKQEAEDVIQSELIPKHGVKFWALAWAGNVSSDGSPATFFYAFNVAEGALC